MAISPITPQLLMQLQQIKRQGTIGGQTAEDQLIKGTVVALETKGGPVATVEVMGQRLKMSVEAWMGLELGKILSFSLASLPDGKLGLQLMADSALPLGPELQDRQTAPQGSPQTDPGEALTNILKSQLKTFGLEANTSNLSLMSAQRGHNLPMNKGTLLQLKGLAFHLQALSQALEGPGHVGLSPAQSLEVLLKPPQEGLEVLRANSSQVASPSAGPGHTPTLIPPSLGLALEGAINQGPGDQGRTVVPTATQADGQAGATSALPMQADPEVQSKPQLQAEPQLEKGTQSDIDLQRQRRLQAEAIKLPEATVKARISQFLSEMVSRPEHMHQTLAFVTAQGIQPTTLNLLISHQWMKGSLGFNAGLVEILEASLNAIAGKAEPLEAAIENALQRLRQDVKPWTQWEDQMDGNALKRQVEHFSDIVASVKNLTLTSENSEFSEQLELVKQALGISNEGAWSSLWLPQPMGPFLSDVEIYIKRDAGKSKAIDPNDALLYVALDTENLGKVRVKIQAKEKHLGIAFMLESQETKRAFENQASHLFAMIKSHTQKDVQLSFQETQGPINLSEFERVGREGIQSFDMRI